MTIFDVLILVFVVLAILHGIQIGLVRQAFGLLGFWGGLILGVVVASHLIGSFSSLSNRALVVAFSVLIGMIIGTTLGNIAGTQISRLVRIIHILWLDKALGAVLGAATALLTVWLLASLFIYIPLPGISDLVRQSRIVSQLDTSLPPPPTFIASLERDTTPGLFPRVFNGLAPLPASPIAEVPTALVQQAMANAQASVVKVEGLACNSVNEGSGFIVASGLVITNAHVVAGMTDPVVYDASISHAARVVFYDPNIDLAALRVNGLQGTPLTLDTDDQPRGTNAAALGYPEGGSFSAVPAGILQHLTAEGQDIYGTSTSLRQLYELQSPIEPGNSGGPLVLPDGRVIGIVFAKSEDDAGIGYALTAGQVNTDIQTAKTKQAPVSTGACISE